MREIDHASRKEPLGPFWAALALILFGVVMAAWHWLLTGIDENFGIGVVVGAAIMAGLLGFLSKRVRNLP